MILAFIALVLPSITSALTGLLKLLPSFQSLQENRTPVIRFYAAVIALIVVLITEWTAGAFDQNVIALGLQTVLLTGSTWVGSLGIFHGIFAKKS